MLGLRTFLSAFPWGRHNRGGVGLDPTQTSTTHLSLHREEAGLLAHSGALEGEQKTCIPLLE